MNTVCAVSNISTEQRIAYNNGMEVHLENESKSYFDSIYFDEFTWDQYFNILHSRQQETKILFGGGGYWKCVEKCYIKWMEYNIQSSMHAQN